MQNSNDDMLSGGKLSYTKLFASGDFILLPLSFVNRFTFHDCASVRIETGNLMLRPSIASSCNACFQPLVQEPS
ncbi:hypothetical protein CQ013_18025 [Arthrobacter sp. MYb216]|nr:hypothetical protein CQ013_18025 [Arthrobacter sp. MYb216]